MQGSKTVVAVNHKRVARLMKQHAVRAITPRKKTKTTDSAHHFMLADNVLNRDFRVGAGNTRWVSDITYLRMWGGFVYLAVTLDVKMRAWLDYAVNTHLQASLCEAAPPTFLH